MAKATSTAEATTPTGGVGLAPGLSSLVVAVSRPASDSHPGATSDNDLGPPPRRRFAINDDGYSTLPKSYTIEGGSGIGGGLSPRGWSDSPRGPGRPLEIGAVDEGGAGSGRRRDSSMGRIRPGPTNNFIEKLQLDQYKSDEVDVDSSLPHRFMDTIAKRGEFMEGKAGVKAFELAKEQWALTVMNSHKVSYPNTILPITQPDPPFVLGANNLTQIGTQAFRMDKFTFGPTEMFPKSGR